MEYKLWSACISVVCTLLFGGLGIMVGRHFFSSPLIGIFMGLILMFVGLALFVIYAISHPAFG